MKINENKSEDKITLKDIILNIQDWFKYLLSKWYVSVGAAIIGAILGFFYSKFSVPMYTATTTFVLEGGDKSNSLGQYAGVAAMVGIDLGGNSGGIFQGDNILELYKSRKMIEATLLIPSKSDSSKLLIDRYLDAHKIKASWEKKSPKLLEIDFRNENQDSMKRSRDSILQHVVIDINKNNLRVAKPSTKLSIVKVDVKSNDEVFSKEFNEELVAQVNDFYVKTKTKKSLDNIQILQHKTDSVTGVINGNIATAAVVIDATPNLNPTRQAQRLVPTQRSQFSAEANRAILGQLVQHLEMSKMALLKEAPLIQTVDVPIYPLEKSTVTKIKGIIIGMFLLGVLSIIVLILRRLYKSVIKN